MSFKHPIGTYEKPLKLLCDTLGVTEVTYTEWRNAAMLLRNMRFEVSRDKDAELGRLILEALRGEIKPSFTIIVKQEAAHADS